MFNKKINLFKKIKKLNFLSKSLHNSEMNWNYSGNGTVEIKENIGKNNQKIYFFEKIVLENGLKTEDKKMWNFYFEKENLKLGFYRFRNNEYEKIFEFSEKENKFVLENEYKCFPDNYYGKVEILGNKIIFIIKILGKRKNEFIRYEYYF